jgi:hypothetical protein
MQDSMNTQNSRGPSAPKGAYKARLNWATCFKNRDRTEDWQPHYVGAVALKDSQKYWACLWVKVNRNGKNTCH